MTQMGAPAVTPKLIWTALRQIVDPDLGINIVDLGLIYDVQIQEGAVAIRMTLMTRGCPLRRTFIQAAERAVRALFGVTQAGVEVVWEPRWTPELMTPEGKRALAG